MLKTLPQEGREIREVHIEGSGKERDVVIVPRVGERLRFPASGDVNVETVGRVLVRATSLDDVSVRLTFTADALILERAKVEFDGDDVDWEKMWRRARARSRPWWHQGGNDEVDLDWAMSASPVLAAKL